MNDHTECEQIARKACRVAGINADGFTISTTGNVMKLYHWKDETLCQCDFDKPACCHWDAITQAVAKMTEQKKSTVAARAKPDISVTIDTGQRTCAGCDKSGFVIVRIKIGAISFRLCQRCFAALLEDMKSKCRT